MLDSFLDLDDLASATAFKSGGSRKALPIIVDGYFTEGLDPTKHHIIGRRIDPQGNGTAVKLYLDPADPTATNTDPNKRRPSILSFEFLEYKAAREAARSSDPAKMDAAINQLTALAGDTRAKTYTEPGGTVIADGVQEPEEGVIVARWIRPGTQSATDDKHIILPIDFATVRRRRDGKLVDIEALRPAEAVLTTSFAELQAALLKVFSSDTNHGTAAAYLRILTTNDGETKATIAGSSAEGGGLIALRDKKVGDKYLPRTADEGLAEFLSTPLGKKLDRPWGTANKIEVIPVSQIMFGEKSMERQRTPDAGYKFPAAEGSAQTIQGYAISTVRLSQVSGSTHYIGAMCLPVTGELYRLEDLPTANHAPEVEPAFAVFAKKDSATDPEKPLEEGFSL